MSLPRWPRYNNLSLARTTGTGSGKLKFTQNTLAVKFIGGPHTCIPEIQELHPPMRLLAFGLGLLLFSSVLPAAESAVVNLQFWTNQSRETDELFEQYSREHPQIHVTVAQSASRNLVDDPQRVICSIVGGDPADIILFDRFAVGEWAARGAFLPLDAFVAADLRAGRPDAIRSDEYYAPCWSEALYQGKLYGIPMGTDDRVLYYNKDMFAKAGISAPPKTWSQLLVDGKKLTHAPNQYGLALLGDQGEDAICSIDSFIFSNGGHVLSADGKTAVVNSPAAVQAIKFLQNLAAIAPAGTVNRAESDAASLFTAGKVAMTLDGSWQQDTYTSQGGSKLHWGVAVPPAPDGKSFRGTLGGWNMVIFKQSAHPDAAWKFLSYLGQKAPQIAIASISPARIDAAQSFLASKRIGAPVLLQTLKNGLPRDLSPIYPQISTVEQTMLQNIFTGMSAQQAADKAASDMNSALQSQ